MKLPPKVKVASFVVYVKVLDISVKDIVFRCDKSKDPNVEQSTNVELFNGKLETRFLQYEMYEGTKKIHKLEK